MSSLSWLGKTLCPPDCLVKSDIKAPSCAAIFRLGIVVLQYVRTGEVFCGLHVAHVHIICPVRDVTHVRKCTRPSPAFPYCKRRKAGRGPGNEARVGVVQSTLQALFRSTIAGVVVQGFRSSSVPVTRVIWSSHADLSGSDPHKLIALPLTLSRHSRWRQSHVATSIISLHFGSSASLSSPFSSSCYVASHCSAFLSC